MSTTIISEELQSMRTLLTDMYFKGEMFSFRLGGRQGESKAGAFVPKEHMGSLLNSIDVIDRLLKKRSDSEEKSSPREHLNARRKVQPARGSLTKKQKRAPKKNIESEPALVLPRSSITTDSPPPLPEQLRARTKVQPAGGSLTKKQKRVTKENIESEPLVVPSTRPASTTTSILAPELGTALDVPLNKRKRRRDCEIDDDTSDFGCKTFEDLQRKILF
jgi:hypothetical protein